VATPSVNEGPSPTEPPPASNTPERKPGTLDNHRVTAFKTVSHDAVRQSTDDGHRWVVRAILRVEPQDSEVATPFPIGVVFVFFDGEGDKLYREYEQVPANTTSNVYTTTVSTDFQPSEAATDTFARYRIELVHP
jgi:hypothetical protein